MQRTLRVFAMVGGVLFSAAGLFMGGVSLSALASLSTAEMMLLGGGTGLYLSTGAWLLFMGFTYRAFTPTLIFGTTFSISAVVLYLGMRSLM